MVEIAPSPLNKGLTNRPLITNIANVCGRKGWLDQHKGCALSAFRSCSTARNWSRSTTFALSCACRAGRRQCASCSNADWQPKGLCRRRLVQNHPSTASSPKRLRHANNRWVSTIPPFAGTPFTEFHTREGPGEVVAGAEQPLSFLGGRRDHRKQPDKCRAGPRGKQLCA